MIDFQHSLLVILFAGLATIIAQGRTGASAEALAINMDIPEVVYASNAIQMTTGNGFLYWSFFKTGPNLRSASVDTPQFTEGYIERYPLNGGNVARLANEGIEYNGLQGSDIGIHYYNSIAGAIVLQPLSEPLQATILVHTARPTSPIVSDAATGMMYWLADGKLFYADRHIPSTFPSSTYGDMTNAGVQAHDLVLSLDGYLYWFGDGKLYRTYKFCTTPGSNCQRETIANEEGTQLLYHEVQGGFVNSNYPLHWVYGNQVHSYGCRLNSLTGLLTCGVSITYAEATPQVRISNLVGYKNNLFWSETPLDVATNRWADHRSTVDDSMARDRRRFRRSFAF